MAQPMPHDIFLLYDRHLGVMAKKAAAKMYKIPRSPYSFDRVADSQNLQRDQDQYLARVKNMFKSDG